MQARSLRRTINYLTRLLVILILIFFAIA